MWYDSQEGVKIQKGGPLIGGLTPEPETAEDGVYQRHLLYTHRAVCSQGPSAVGITKGCVQIKNHTYRAGEMAQNTPQTKPHNNNQNKTKTRFPELRQNKSSFFFPSLFFPSHYTALTVMEVDM